MSEMSEEMGVDVVCARLADFADLSRFAAALSAGEHARARGYKMTESRDTFILARGLLRLELAKRLACDPGDIHFDVRLSGKPDVRAATPPRPDWRFSVSHTGPYVAIAFALGIDVGVDIERLDRNVKPLDIARRYFTPTELLSLEGTPEGARVRAFLAGWTRKEAIVKARGNTMAESLATLSVGLDPEEMHPPSEDAPTAPVRATCRLASFQLSALNLIGAVALRSSRLPRLGFDVLSAARFD
jgi:4'-phosphopantetheinyl transferase